MFTTEEIADMCGLPTTTLNQWVAAGVIKPLFKGHRAVPHRFSARQALGLAVAAAVHQSERGCARRRVGMIVQVYEAMDDATLERWLEESHRASDLHGE